MAAFRQYANPPVPSDLYNIKLCEGSFQALLQTPDYCTMVQCCPCCAALYHPPVSHVTTYHNMYHNIWWQCRPRDRRNTTPARVSRVSSPRVHVVSWLPLYLYHWKCQCQCQQLQVQFERQATTPAGSIPHSAAAMNGTIELCNQSYFYIRHKDLKILQMQISSIKNISSVVSRISSTSDLLPSSCLGGIKDIYCEVAPLSSQTSLFSAVWPRVLA